MDLSEITIEKNQTVNIKDQFQISPNKEFYEFKEDNTHQSIIKRFETQVERYPDNIAVQSFEERLTYRELNQMANLIANQLLTKHQVNRKGYREIAVTTFNETTQGRNQEVVALLFKHGVEMLPAILGVLKAGKIYVPLDPTYPEERLTYIIEDSGAEQLICDQANQKYANMLARKVKQRLEVKEVITNLSEKEESLLENPGINIEKDQIAYIIYTSGSTGKPKGVIQTHRNIVKFIHDYSNQLRILPEDRIGLLTSYSHTVAVIDIFSALLNGATVCPYDIKVIGSIEKMADWLNQQMVTIFHTVPTVYRHFINTLTNGSKISGIRLVIIGGESVSQNDVESFKKYFTDKCIFVNLFGSSEVLIATSYLINKTTEITNNTVPVGYPVKGVEIRIVNEKDEDLGVYEVGELVFKSDYLAKGYWKQPEKTREAFSIDGRIFRSGDLGRFLPDGCIEYLGRKDCQIKICGNRIELREIELVLNGIEGIKDSVVNVQRRNNEEPVLIAYYTTIHGNELDKDYIRKCLGQFLPEYMIPAYYVFLKEIPLTPNGKIDRNALPEIDYGKTKFIKPKNKIEKKLVYIWKEVLGVNEIGVNENFFELGGHSLKAMALITKINDIFAISLNNKDLFSNPTISRLSIKINDKVEQRKKFDSILKRIEKMDQEKVKKILNSRQKEIDMEEL